MVSWSLMIALREDGGVNSLGANDGIKKAGKPTSEANVVVHALRILCEGCVSYNAYYSASSCADSGIGQTIWSRNPNRWPPHNWTHDAIGNRPAVAARAWHCS
jgi:hypothetical protein